MAAGVVVAAVIIVAMPQALVGVYYDDGIYLALAKSLAEGHGYHLQYLPGMPAAVHYPFGYPLFLAALWKLAPAFPGNVTLFRGANAVLMGVFAGLAAAYLIPRIRVPAWLTAVTIVLAATAIPVIAVATVLFAEPLFLVLTALACWLADAARESGDASGRRATGLTIGAGCLAGAAALTRSIGVAAIGGIVLSFAFRRQWRSAVAAGVPAALLLLPWMLWTNAHHAAVDPLIASGYGTYGDFMKQGGSATLSLSSLAEVVRPLGALALPPLPGEVRLTLGLIVLPVLVYGLCRLLKLVPALGWMMLCYLAIVLVWPYGPDRFLWGVLPWLAVAFVAGAHGLITWPAPDRRRGYRVVGALASAIVVAGFGLFQLRVGLHGATSAQVEISATMNDLLPWIRAQTDSTSVVAGEDEALIWLYTGRQAVPSFLWRVDGRAAESFGPDSLQSWFEKNRVTHMILTGPNSDAAGTVNELLARRPGYLQLVRVWPGRLMAFRVHGGG